MREKLIQYVNGLFAHAPDTAQVRELHDELLQNTLDRYDDELASGKSERDAYDAAVAAIGDVESLLAPLRPRKHGTLLRALAVCCYILAIVPPIMLEDNFGAAGLFALAAVGTVLCLLSGNGGQTASGRLRAAAVGLFILSVIPPILLSDSGSVSGVVGMIVTVAAAAVLLVLANSRNEPTPQAEPQTVAAAIVEKNAPPRLPVAVRIIIALMWVAASLAFVWQGFAGHWFYAWALFPFTGAVTDILRGIVLLLGGKRGGGKYLLDGILWVVVVQIYWALTAQSGAWYVTWMVMPLGALATGVLHGILALVGGRGSTGKSIVKIVLCAVFGVILCGVLSGSLYLTDCESITLPALEELHAFDWQDNGYLSGDTQIGAKIDRMEVHWDSGSVLVSEQDVEEIQISCKSKEETLLWKVENGTLYIRCKRSWANLFGITARTGALQIVLPEGYSLSEAEFTSSSAGVTLNDLNIGSVSVDGASADVTLNSCAFDKLEINTASGACELKDSTVTRFDMDTASGNAKLQGKLTEVYYSAVSGDLTLLAQEAPRHIEAESVSGNSTVYLPADSGFTASLESVSGDLMTSGFAVTRVNDSYVCGDGSAVYRFESVSGDVQLCLSE